MFAAIVAALGGILSCVEIVAKDVVREHDCSMQTLPTVGLHEIVGVFADVFHVVAVVGNINILRIKFDNADRLMILRGSAVGFLAFESPLQPPLHRIQYYSLEVCPDGAWTYWAGNVLGNVVLCVLSCGRSKQRQQAQRES